MVYFKLIITKLFSIAIHGGAFNTKKTELPSSLQKKYKEALSESLDAGYTILKSGDTAINAVVAAIKKMEDSPLFNAGRGSVIAHDNHIYMDASLMNGKLLTCGAVGNVTTIKNPIAAAQKVMENSDYVFMVEEGAEKFAEEQNIEIVPNIYFITEARQKQFLQKLQKDIASAENENHGTVGCVAMDKFGNLAAGTSTGGMANKKYGHIGDSAVIGAGTYASNKTCAVSCTGKGEDFIRLAVAHDISALMEYKSFTLKKAVDKVIREKLKKIQGSGGCIAINKHAEIYMAYISSGMFRGQIDKNGKKFLAVLEK